MASDLPLSRYQMTHDLRVLRNVMGWQSFGYDMMMRHGLVSLMQPGDFIYFSLSALSGLVPLLSSFLMQLEHYGLQLQHLLPHSITMVAIFVNFCKMFMGVRPSVRLFRRFHMLHAMNMSPPLIGGYSFQHQVKGLSKYIAAVSPGRCEHWRED
jgi:hypothetical protein